MTEPIWTPSPARLESHRLSKYAEHVAQRYGRDFRYDYSALHRWSVTEPAEFWTSLIEFAGIVFEGELSPAIVDGDQLPGAHWFPNVRLNYAENLLRHPPERPAVIACDESGRRREYSFGDLHAETRRHMAALQAAGVGVGDAVAAILPNIYEALPAMLGTTGLGAKWCSVSPDFGPAGILDRLGQVAPRLLYTVQRYRHNGRDYDVSGKIASVVEQLPSVERVVIVDSGPCAHRSPQGTVTLDVFLAAATRAVPPFRRLPFDHPLFVLFTSGTTGVPKCIEHGGGGNVAPAVQGACPAL